MWWPPVGGRVSSPREVCEGPYRMCLRSAPQTEEGTLLPMASLCSLWAQLEWFREAPGWEELWSGRWEMVADVL